MKPFEQQQLEEADGEVRTLLRVLKHKRGNEQMVEMGFMANIIKESDMEKARHALHEIENAVHDKIMEIKPQNLPEEIIKKFSKEAQILLNF